MCLRRKCKASKEKISYGLDYQFTPLTERKTISMDYEEYLKLEKRLLHFML
nr:MAG TPA: hypothetical protein [Bacteriophage sp.]